MTAKKTRVAQTVPVRTLRSPINDATINDAWIRKVSTLHLYHDFDEYAYNIPFLRHLVSLIGLPVEGEDEEPERIVVETVDDDPTPTGTGNTRDIHWRNVDAWIKACNLTRQGAADELGWHRSSLSKILHRERLVNEEQAVGFVKVIEALEGFKYLQYLAILKGNKAPVLPAPVPPVPLA